MRREILIRAARLMWRLADQFNRVAVLLFVRATG
jgi:hypothetical protein